MKAMTTLTSLDVQARERMNFILCLQLQAAVFLSMAGIGAEGGAGPTDASSGFRQLYFGVMALLSVGYLVIVHLGKRDTLSFSLGGWPIITALLYISASTLWSVTPTVTAKRAILLAILIVVCGVSVGMRNRDWREDLFSKLMAKPMGLLLALSVLVTLAAPGKAFSDIGWRGIASHKNEAGQMMAFATVLLLYGVCHDRMGGKLRAVLVAIAFGGLLMAKSTTALLGVVVAVGITELITFRSTIRRLASWQIAFAAILLIVSCGLFFAFQLDLLPSASVMYSQLLEALGKSETFTGRTAIWNLVLGESRFHNPWLGGGYGAFWVGRDSISGYVIMGDNLYPGQSHNGYIDVYNDLGYIGVGMLGLLIIMAVTSAARLLMAGHVEGKLHLAIILHCVFLNLGESTFLRTTTFMNIIFIASFIRMAGILRQRRAEKKQDDNGTCPVSHNINQ